MNNVDHFLVRKRMEREAAGIVERRTIILDGDGAVPAPRAAEVVMDGCALVPYEASDDPEEDNRRRRAAGMPERKGKWGKR